MLGDAYSARPQLRRGPGSWRSRRETAPWCQEGKIPPFEPRWAKATCAIRNDNYIEVGKNKMCNSLLSDNADRFVVFSYSSGEPNQTVSTLSTRHHMARLSDSRPVLDQKPFQSEASILQVAEQQLQGPRFDVTNQPANEYGQTAAHTAHTWISTFWARNPHWNDL